MQKKAATTSKELPMRRYSGSGITTMSAANITQSTIIPQSRCLTGPGMQSGMFVLPFSGSSCIVVPVLFMKYIDCGQKRAGAIGSRRGMSGAMLFSGVCRDCIGRQKFRTGYLTVEVRGAGLRTGIAYSIAFLSGTVMHTVEEVEHEADSEPENEHDMSVAVEVEDQKSATADAEQGNDRDKWTAERAG